MVYGNKLCECIYTLTKDGLSSYTSYPPVIDLSNTRESEKTEPIIPVKIIRNAGATVVFWNDGTKTIVVKEDGCEDSEYHAFCAAYAKKMFGSTDKVMKLIEATDALKIKERCRAAEEKRKKKAQEAYEKRLKEKFNEDVRRKAYELKLSKAAEEELAKKK